MSEALRRVMLVDDDEDIRRVAQLALEMVGGFEVRLCACGAEALAALAPFRPQLAVLDFMMPEMDGPALLGRLRGEPLGTDLPVVFLTARAQADEVERLRALGALGVIAKPFDPMAIAAELKALWEARPARGA
ncbi:MAG: response regulator [Burkholderiales bacterium]|nr:response regulator [Burkholderiales bacterium]